MHLVIPVTVGVIIVIAVIIVLVERERTPREEGYRLLQEIPYPHPALNANPRADDQEGNPCFGGRGQGLNCNQFPLFTGTEFEYRRKPYGRKSPGDTSPNGPIPVLMQL